MQAAAQLVPPGSFVLDAGAGDCTYRPLFTHVQYESADFCQVEGKTYGEITYRCDLSDIPVENERYDLIICTQVLEHLPEPKTVLREFHRILKPGKQIWITAPLFYAEHEVPHDYFRYTRYGLSHILKECGFEVSHIEALEGYYGALAYQCEMAAFDLPLNSKKFGGGGVGVITALLAILIKPYFFLLSLFFARLDLKYKNLDDGICKNYAVIALRKN